ncbi:unnamed protein product [Rhizophagus irregularis]|uniref:Reverse transcriptase domain-containing protein n=1 Tax=Rhizophagus irregularis TaxID=588596 RepID=A0A2I1HFP8_9GLOM|nr:hypothetical protein RhiirA4_478869 [Rhizophagus irregularis]CAB4427289.1 unnamed protein product [Rhizophagus irregularis]
MRKTLVYYNVNGVLYLIKLENSISYYYYREKTLLFKIPEKLLYGIIILLSFLPHLYIINAITTEDVQTHQKELWIAFQDISKAFDSTSIDGLEIFLKHVDIPANVDM